MRQLLVITLLCACKKDVPEKPELRASCKPNPASEALECVVENVGKQPGRACVTARVQPPKAQPLIAKRLCTKALAPGEKVSLSPKFDGHASLQPVCSPDGQWVCKDDIVEQPHELGDNISDGK